MKALLLAAALLAAAAFIPGAAPAAAQSFDCAKAAKPDEKAVCADAALGNLDTKMATLWWVVEQVPMMMGARGAARDDQQAFLKTRAACGADTACLTKAYDARIAALQAQVKDQMQQYCKAIQLC